MPSSDGPLLSNSASVTIQIRSSDALAQKPFSMIDLQVKIWLKINTWTMGVYRLVHRCPCDVLALQ
eukprot:2605626-Amphidinium_carterae.1